MQAIQIVFLSTDGEGKSLFSFAVGMFTFLWYVGIGHPLHISDISIGSLLKVHIKFLYQTRMSLGAV